MLGVCYYPEHWPEDWWAADARRMRELGIVYVRIGEFAWSHYEPRRAEFAWGWLDRAMETLGSAGLKIVLGTPTAAPPKWLMDEFPEIAPIDEQGRPRGFGSRRHYTFSSQAYWRESLASRRSRRSSCLTDMNHSSRSSVRLNAARAE
jgi:beta-galactosidase